MKRIISAAFIAMMVVSSNISAYAADYSTVSQKHQMSPQNA